MNSPPSTEMMSPLMNSVPSRDKARMAFATSCGVVMRPVGFRFMVMSIIVWDSGILSSAGVTVTPALLKIPESQQMIDLTMKRNPTGRMTTPQDVANAIVALSGPGTDFINGDVISVDGGEFITGS